MLDHQGQISILATAAREPVYVSTLILYSLAYDATDVMDDDNHVTALSSQGSGQHSADLNSQKTISEADSLG